MPDVNCGPPAVETEGRRDSQELLTMVYTELRHLAAARLSRERPGQTLEATALVHEAYMRLVNAQSPRQWDNEGHFFAAADEAMRRILVDRARHKQSVKAGGKLRRVAIPDAAESAMWSPADLLALDDALAKLAEDDPPAAEVARLRLLAGLSLDETAERLDLPRTTTFRNWTYARAFLQHELRLAESDE